MKNFFKQRIKPMTACAFTLLLVSHLLMAAKEPIRIYHDGNINIPPGTLRVEELKAHPEIQKVLITVHGIFSDAEDLAPKAQNIAHKSGYDAYLSFEYRKKPWYNFTSFEYENDTLYKAGTAKAAVALAILVAQIHSSTGITPSIIAHSQGSTILLKAAILAAGLSKLAQGIKPDSSFYGVWDWLSQSEKATLQKNVGLIQSFSFFDVAITEGTTAKHNDAGWGTLESRTTGKTPVGTPAVFNLHSNIDIANILLTKSEAGEPIGYISRLGNRNIYVHVPHTGYNIPEVIAIESDLISDKHLSENTAIKLIKHNLSNIGELQLQSAIEEWKKNGFFPPPPPPPPPFLMPSIDGMSNVLLPLRFGSTSTMEMPVDILAQALNKIDISVYGTGSPIGIRLVVTNNNLLPISFTPRQGTSFSPGAQDIQGMVLAGASIVPLSGFNAAPAMVSSTQKIQTETSFTVPSLKTVEVLLSAVCLNYFRPNGSDVMDPPGDDYNRFTIEFPGESSSLTKEKNEQVLRVLEGIRQTELKSQEEPVPEGTPFFSVWKAIELLKQIHLETIQIAVWAITDDWTYWDLKRDLQAQNKQIDEEIQLTADIVNLILQEAKVPLRKGHFLPAFDINWDFEVDLFDLALVAKYLGEKILLAYPHPDVNRDGIVDLFDLIQVGKHLDEIYNSHHPQASPPRKENHLVKISKENRFSLGIVGQFSELIENLSHRFSLQDNEHSDITVSNGSSITQESARVQIEVCPLDKKTFTTMIVVDSIQNLIGYQLDLVYDQSLLEVIEVQEGSLLKDNGGKTYFLKPKLFAGKVKGVAALKTDGKSVKGKGVLTSITFRLKDENPTFSHTSVQEKLALTRVKLSDPNGNPIPVFFDKNKPKLEVESVHPPRSAVLQNYPNPFNPETWIPYDLAEEGEVSVFIFDVYGRLVRTIHVGHRLPGTYRSPGRAVYWDGTNNAGERVASGIYFYTLKAGKYVATKRMIIIK